MPTYSFQAKDRSGARVAGRVIEADEAQARARLEKTRPDLCELVVRRDYAAVPGELANLVRPVPGTEVATFLRQLWLMFRAGVQLTRAIAILRDGYPNHRLREALYEVDRNLQEGHALSQAMSRFPGIFPGEICGLVKVGEATGQMEDVLDFAARLMEENDQRLRRVKSALTYPTFILIVSVLMCGSLLLFFVPRMADVMRMIPGEMSTPVLVLLTLSSFLSNRVVVFTICLSTLLGLVGAWLWSQTARGKRWWDGFLLTFPITRPLIRHLSMARVAFGLHLMVGCGLSLTQSLTLITEGMPSYRVSEALGRVRERVVEGEGLGVSMADEPLFGQAVLVQMVEVAEESSSLDTLMHRAYLFHRDQLESSLDTLTALVEPIIMAGMGLVVGGMVITFMLPLVRLVQTL
ncbi:MAG: type II secretion system F family protein [Vulcanimicrobiota bacterium]